MHKLDRERIKAALKEDYPGLENDLETTTKGYIYLMHERILHDDIEAAPSVPAPADPAYTVWASGPTEKKEHQ